MKTTTQSESTVLADATPCNRHDGDDGGGAEGDDAGAAEGDDGGGAEGDDDDTGDSVVAVAGLTRRDDTPAALDSVRLHIDDLLVLAESATLWLERVPPGRNEPERVAVESLVRLVERMARDLRYLWIFADETFNDVAARLGRCDSAHRVD